MLVAGILLFVSGRKVRHVIKLRKWIVYLFKNVHKKQIIKHKIWDISKHVKDILEGHKQNKNNQM